MTSTRVGYPTFTLTYIITHSHQQIPNQESQKEKKAGAAAKDTGKKERRNGENKKTAKHTNLKKSVSFHP
jgi:hypothetical protein